MAPVPFGWVRLRFVHGTVRPFLIFSDGGGCLVFQHSQHRHSRCSVPERWFWRFSGSSSFRLVEKSKMVPTVRVRFLCMPLRLRVIRDASVKVGAASEKAADIPRLDPPTTPLEKVARAPPVEPLQDAPAEGGLPESCTDLQKILKARNLSPKALSEK